MGSGVPLLPINGTSGSTRGRPTTSAKPGADFLRVQVIEGSDVLDLDAIELDCVGTGVTRLYEVPGRTLHLATVGFGTHHVIVFGRP